MGIGNKGGERKRGVLIRVIFMTCHDTLLSCHPLVIVVHIWYSSSTYMNIRYALIIPFSLCGTNSQNTHYLPNLKTSEGLNFD